jgi:hypothetical protein
MRDQAKMELICLCFLGTNRTCLLPCERSKDFLKENGCFPYEFWDSAKLKGGNLTVLEMGKRGNSFSIWSWPRTLKNPKVATGVSKTLITHMTAHLLCQQQEMALHECHKTTWWWRLLAWRPLGMYPRLKIYSNIQHSGILNHRLFPGMWRFLYFCK